MKGMRFIKKFIKSKFVESNILGTAGLIAITVGGLIVYIIGIVFNLDYLSKPFTDELLLIVEYPFFFIIAALIKIVIGGKIIEWSVRIISKALGIQKITIVPDEPITIIRKNKLYRIE